MNLGLMVLLVIEALVAVVGLVFGVYAIATGMHFVGPLMGFTIFVVFALFVYGMWLKGVKHVE